MMGWHLPHFVSTSSTGLKIDIGPSGVNVKIKMISGASPSSAYCFLTYPNAEMAEHAWKMISNMPPTLMPGCERTFKLNWATGLPGVQPTWDREFSVFIRDLDREVTEGELVALFTCSFPSTKSAKIMGDLSTGLSRGYAFIRFGEESDMHRALALGRSKSGTGLFLRGRCIKITEASGSSGTAGDHSHHRTSISTSHKPRSEQASSHSMTVHQDEHLDARLKNSISSNTSVTSSPSPHEFHNSSVRNNRDSICQNPAVISSSSSARLSSSYPPGNNSVISARGVPSSLANDSSNPKLRMSRDGGTQAVGRLASSMSALRLSGCPPISAASNVPHTTSAQANAPSFGRTFPTGSSLMTRAQSIPNPTFQSHYAPLLPHPVCGFTAQGLLSSSQTQYPPYEIGPPVGSMFTSCPLPMARAVAPQPSQIHSNTPTQPMFPNLNSSVGNQNSYPTAYITPPGLFSPPNGVNAVNCNQQYNATLPSTYESGMPPRNSETSPNSINSHLAALSQIVSVANDASNDPSNTTVFVGGLPACISEGTLKTFFQNFGEITYVKIPPNKGCGFVQYVRREDAKQAMLKMHDFPIHGKSRIRLSWGRSLGDKQVEYVKKLSSALGISFESVWKIVQGQDPSMIKHIALTLSGGAGGAQPLAAPSGRPNLSTRRDSDQSRSVQSLSGLGPNISHRSNYNPAFLANGQPSTSSFASPSAMSPSGYMCTEPISMSSAGTENTQRTSNHLFVNEVQDELRRSFITKPQPQRPSTSHSSGFQPISPGPGTSPAPSVGPRNSWQGLLPHEKLALTSERAMSTTLGTDLPNALPNRRATIHPITPIPMPSTNIPDSQFYQIKAPTHTTPPMCREGSFDSLESKWTSLGLKHMTRSHCAPIKEKHEYHLNRLDILGEMSKVDFGEDKSFQLNPPPLYDGNSSQRFQVNAIAGSPPDIPLGVQTSTAQASAMKSLESCWSFPL